MDDYREPELPEGYTPSREHLERPVDFALRRMLSLMQQLADAGVTDFDRWVSDHERMIEVRVTIGNTPWLGEGDRTARVNPIADEDV